MNETQLLVSFIFGIIYLVPFFMLMMKMLKAGASNEEPSWEKLSFSIFCGLLIVAAVVMELSYA